MKLTFLGPISRPPENLTKQVEQDFTGGTVEDLLTQLQFQRDQQKYITVFRLGKRLKLSSEIHPEDHLTIMLLVGGG